MKRTVAKSSQSLERFVRSHHWENLSLWEREKLLIELDAFSWKKLETEKTRQAIIEQVI